MNDARVTASPEQIRAAWRLLAERAGSLPRMLTSTTVTMRDVADAVSAALSILPPKAEAPAEPVAQTTNEIIHDLHTIGATLRAKGEPIMADRLMDTEAHIAALAARAEATEPSKAGWDGKPTEAMLDAARDWSYKLYGKPIGKTASEECWAAMWAASPLAAVPSPQPGERAEHDPLEAIQGTAEEAGKRFWDKQPDSAPDPLAEAVGLLDRLIKTAAAGQWRDGAQLSLNAHPLMDDVRFFLAKHRVEK